MFEKGILPNTLLLKHDYFSKQRCEDGSKVYRVHAEVVDVDEVHEGD